jgi:hypothetical protein
MVLNHVWGLFAHPADEWKSIREERCTVTKCYCSHVLLLSALPVIAGYIGVTHYGFQIGSREALRWTTESALNIAILSYLTMLVAVFSLGKAIHWMGQTYGSKTSLPQSIALAAYAATPLWLSGVLFFYPVLWVILLAGLPALAYTVFLLYTGLPIMMGIPKERGFLFSSAVLAVGLVMLVTVMAITVILWESGIGPNLAN